MELALNQAGVQMPKFGKIGGILAKELGNDVAERMLRVGGWTNCSY
jgi:hypothetical protein